MLRARWVLPLAVGAGLGAALARQEPRERAREAEGLLARLPVLPSVAAASLPAPPGSGRTELSKYGLPGLAQLRSRESYVLCYDPRSRSALWVIEQLNRDTLSGASDRAACDFQEDDSVHEYHRATNADYRGSGFDRGHLAAAANHRWSQKAMKDTFYLSNIAPQVRPEARGGSRSCPRSGADTAPCGPPPGRVAVFVPAAVQAEGPKSLGGAVVPAQFENRDLGNAPACVCLPSREREIPFSAASVRSRTKHLQKIVALGPGFCPGCANQAQSRGDSRDLL